LACRFVKSVGLKSQIPREKGAEDLDFVTILTVFALVALSIPEVSSVASAWHSSDSAAQQTKGQGITDKDVPQDADAQYQLGLKYARGTGVTRDDALAARLFRKAAEQGHAEAQAALGFAYHLLPLS
jgi:TPR repeat protein